MLNKFPEIRRYIGETKETDHPEDDPDEFFKKIGEFIVEKEDIDERILSLLIIIYNISNHCLYYSLILLKFSVSFLNWR